MASPEEIYIIAEAEINHNGDKSIAKQMIEQAKKCGADCIKFQYIIADEIADPGSKFYNLFKNVELSYEDFAELKNFADDYGMDFMMTVPSVTTAKLTYELGIKKIKIGSSNLTNHILLREIAKYKSEVEIFISTGMAYMGDIEKALSIFDYDPCEDRNFTLFHCTVNYPADFKNLNLNAITSMAVNFSSTRIGYSDHTEGSVAAVAAVALGAEVFEKHFTLDKNADGPDHFFSTPPDQFSQYVRDIRNAAAALGTYEKQPAGSEYGMLEKTKRFLIFKEDVKAGSLLTPDLFNTKRVGAENNAVPVSQIDIIERLNAPRDYKKGELLKWSDFSSSPS